MTTRMTFGFGILVCLATPVLADDLSEVDVRSADFLDVIETADGSIWKGVVVEQTPNVQYKIATADGSLHVIKAEDVVKLTKQRNRDRRVATTSSAGAPVDDGVSQRYESGSGLPKPMAHDGLRVSPEVAVVFPTGDYDAIDTSFAPGVRIGHEALFGNFGIGGGGHVRFTYWRLPGDTKDATWLLETQFYGQAALHIGRAAPYVGVSFGLDTNYFYSNAASMSDTFVGFGMNLQSGLQIAASPNAAIDIGFDYHPGTDTSIGDTSCSYFAMRVGSTFRL